MKKLEEEFNLQSSIYDTGFPSDELDNAPQYDIVELEDALTISEKINMALREVKGMEVHDTEMDEIAREAMDSYAQLMSLGMNVQDMASGPVFSNAAAMLKIALDAKDSKVSRKLKQIDLMLKKANLDQRTKKADPADADSEEVAAKVWDRNELIAMLSGKDSAE
jgi:hypothetical protein